MIDTLIDRMRESTAVIVASTVKTTQDQVVAHHQYILDHEQTLILHQTCTVGLAKHLLLYTGRISE